MSKKTSGQIEEHVYLLIKNSSLNHDLKGTIYRPGLRPRNADTEDLVIQRPIGTSDQVQIGIVNINVYVPNMTSNGESVKDVDRCIEVEKLLNDFVETLVDVEYAFELDEMVSTEQEEGIDQYFVNARLKFKTI